MKTTTLLIALLTWITASSALADTGAWSAGWGMGVSEYLVDDGQANALNISCPDDTEQGYISAYATLAGNQYSSTEAGGFDVIIDGYTYSNPFDTDCHVCGAMFPDFWKDLRKAKRLELSAGGVVVQLPTQNIGTVLMPLDNPKNTCRSAW